jgi:hypothetical protein
VCPRLCKYQKSSLINASALFSNTARKTYNYYFWIIFMSDDIYTVLNGSSAAEEFAAEYYAQVESGIVHPSLFEVYGPTAADLPIDDDATIVFRKDMYTIAGLGAYRYVSSKAEGIDRMVTMTVGNPREWQLDYPWSRDPCFDNYRSGNLLRLDGLESFQPGTGSTLLQHLQEDLSSEGIMLWSCASAKGFYKKMGMRQVGPDYTAEGSAIMLWLKAWGLDYSADIAAGNSSVLSV